MANVPTSGELELVLLTAWVSIFDSSESGAVVLLVVLVWVVLFVVWFCWLILLTTLFRSTSVAKLDFGVSTGWLNKFVASSD